METLKDTLMMRNELSSEEADEIIEEMKGRIAEGDDPEEILLEEGLEFDYVFDLIYPQMK
jgi:hypothetical protein